MPAGPKPATIPLDQLEFELSRRTADATDALLDPVDPKRDRLDPDAVPSERRGVERMGAVEVVGHARRPIEHDAGRRGRPGFLLRVVPRRRRVSRLLEQLEHAGTRRRVDEREPDPGVFPGVVEPRPDSLERPGRGLSILAADPQVLEARAVAILVRTDRVLALPHVDQLDLDPARHPERDVGFLLPHPVVVAGLGDRCAELMEGAPAEAVDALPDGRLDVVDDEADLGGMESGKAGVGHGSLGVRPTRIGGSAGSSDGVERAPLS